LELEEMMGVRRFSPSAANLVSPAFGATAAGATYFATAGPRAAGVAGAMGLGAVMATHLVYSLFDIPQNSQGFLFF
jgi:hypothetical protein